MPRILPGETDIYAITDAGLSLGRPLEEVVSALMGAGVRILQYREKKLKSGAMLEECRLLRRLTKEAGACFIVNDPVDIAMRV
ncbi:MAG: thiamine phosphate synthase, partial [Desulfovibrio desulfuricans]|nr:thiamine phosphate synthase [Desulfovibrio desulfuricans]